MMRMKSIFRYGFLSCLACGLSACSNFAPPPNTIDKDSKPDTTVTQSSFVKARPATALPSPPPPNRPEQVISTVQVPKETSTSQPATIPRSPHKARSASNISLTAAAELSEPTSVPVAGETAKEKTLSQGYVARVKADNEMFIGSAGMLQVWVGLASQLADAEKGKSETRKEFVRDSEKKSAKVVPIAFEFEPQLIGKDCTELADSGSEVSFALRPKKLGKFKVSASVELYKSDDCSGTPQAIVVQDAEVTVKVNIGPQIQNGFWELVQKTWAAIDKLYFAILSAICGAALIFANKKIKKFFGIAEKSAPK